MMIWSDVFTLHHGYQSITLTELKPKVQTVKFLWILVFQISNYQGPARVVVQLVTAVTPHPQLHAHSLVGKQCDKGICIADLQPKDSNIRSARQ